MQFFYNLSIRYKISIGFLVVVSIFVLQGFASKNSLQLVYHHFQVVSQENQPAVEKAGLLNSQIEAVFGAMGNYLLTGDAAQEKEFVVGLKRVSISMKLLKKEKAIASDTLSIEAIDKISKDVKEIQKIQPRLLALSKDSNKNILAVGYAQENLNPLNRDLLQLASQMISSEDEEEYIDERKEILALVNNLRYSWASVMTELRLFLAFKAPSATDNIKLYSSTVDDIIARLIELQDNDDLLTLDQSDSLERFIVIKKQFMSNFDELVKIHSSDAWRQDAYIVKTEVTPLLLHIKEQIDALVYRQKENITLAQERVDTIYQAQATQFYTVLAIAIVIALIITWLLSRLITNSLNWAVHLANEISKGNLKNDIQAKSTDEMGHLFDSLSHMQTELNNNIETERVISRENARVKTALDNISGNVLVIDNKDKIVYVNHMAQQLFDRIDQLSLETGSISNVLTHDVFKSEYQECDKETLKYGANTVLVTSNKIFAEDGELLGKVYEIEDKTFELSMESEIANVVSLAMSGELETKIELSNKTGFFATLSSNTNELLSIVENALMSLNESMQTLAEGDLTRDIEQVNVGIFGEVESAAAKTVSQLRTITQKISSSARVIDEISQEISQGNANLSMRSEQQAAALEQTAASIAELTSTVAENSSNSIQANDLAKEAQTVAQDGGGVINDAIIAMQEINESSTKIADIIGVIDEIAFQTNLLALNASVEAARAGEQGRGFAVVATEVRNLAQRSATAAKEIKELINDSVKKVETGTKLVNESGKSLTEIENGVKKVVDIIGEIAAASEEQSRGIQEVNVAVTSMDTLTQQNAALAEEVTAASINLSERSTIMQQDVSFFKTEEGSTGHQSNRLHFNEVIVFDEDDRDEKVEIIEEKIQQSDSPKVEFQSSDDWEEF